MDCATPLAPEVREKFLRDVAHQLSNHLKLGPGAFHRLVHPTSSVVLVNEELRPCEFQGRRREAAELEAMQRQRLAARLQTRGDPPKPAPLFVGAQARRIDCR